MAHVAVNDTCNLGCTFCRIGRSGERAAEAVRGDLERPRGDGTITFGGGEPTLDGRLETWLREARDGGAGAVEIETNAVLLADPERVRALVESGLTRARVMLPAADPDTWSRVTGAGGLEHAWAGARTLLDAGVEVRVVTPVSSSNAAGIAAVGERVAAELPEARAWILRPVFFDVRDAEAPDRRDAETLEVARRELAPFDVLGAALGSAAEEARARGVAFQIDATGGLPLCALRDHRDALAAAVPPGRPVPDGRKPEACGDCALYERCTGQHPVHRSLLGAAAVRPFRTVPPELRTDASPEPIMLISRGMPTRRNWVGEKAEIRVVLPCNQACTFCFVDRQARSASLVELESAVDEAAARGVKAIVFTGGEPTLSPQLPALVRRATERFVPWRGIQTNALRLADGDLADRLLAAGLNHAHVSLHAVDPAIYLAITGAGTPDETARGAARLLLGGCEVSVSFVLCRENLGHVDPTLRFIRSRLGPVKVVVSVAREQSGLGRPWETTLVRYADAAPAMARALELCGELGMPASSSGTCAFPPCVLPEPDRRRFGAQLAVPHRTFDWTLVRQEDGTGGGDHANLFVPQCARCAARERCPGIQRSYLERHGAAEFVPVEDAAFLGREPSP